MRKKLHGVPDKERRTAYSFVIDADPDFLFQSLLLIATLIHNAEVDPADIHAHVLDGVDRNLEHAFKAIGVNVHRTEAFHPHSPHCNKINQLKTSAWANYEQVVFCDCDIAVADGFIENVGDNQVSGKLVDYPNPPIAIIENVFRSAGLPFSAHTKNTSFRRSANGALPQHSDTCESSLQTHPANLNGGLLVIASSVVSGVVEAWSKWALWLIEERHLLDRYSVHVDQVSFALAMAELNIEPNLLPLELNFPTHLPIDRTGAELPSEVAVLHYHRAVDEVGLPVHGDVGPVTDAIQKVRGAWEQFSQTLRSHGDPHVRLIMKRRERWVHWRNVVEKRALCLPDHMDMEKPIVAIETLGECNYKCAYCPVSVTPKRQGRMSQETYEKVLDDLVHIDGDVQLRLHFYNEPLLDKRLPDFIRLAKKKLPNTYVRVVSNGNLLTLQVAEKLFSAGLDNLAVSGHEQEDVERVVSTFRGSEFEELIEVRNAFQQVSWSDRRASVELEQENFVRQIPAGVKSWGCSFLTVQIDYLGQVHQCCEDYAGDLILGNIKDRSVRDIVESHKLKLKKLFCGRFDDTCAHCAGFDVSDGELAGYVGSQC